MGVSITAKNSNYDFDMGYGAFFNLRKNIAFALDEKFGEHYSQIIYCHTMKDFEKHDEISNWLIKDRDLDSDVIEFLYLSDCGGEISYKTCKKIYDLIKDKDFHGERMRYALASHNDYEEFKEFLHECYTKKRKMRWS